jgi:hypothetical protein
LLYLLPQASGWFIADRNGGIVWLFSDAGYGTKSLTDVNLNFKRGALFKATIELPRAK